eukprot:g2777.t1
MITTAMVLLILSSAVLLSDAALGIYRHGWWASVLPCVLFVAPDFFMKPAIMTLLLQPFKDKSGTASGLFNLIWKAVANSCAVVVSYFVKGEPKLMLGGMGALLVLSELWFWPVLGVRRKERLAAA